ncbi:MAG: Crp/Fnr family transcriptional regulator [Deltaproteobacteria bacterium]|nr:Crp/Fnr family transcriptional regulator [Deltaproteobacteria bacterium]
MQPAAGVVARHLATLPAFRGLNASDRERIAAEAFLRMYTRGEALFHVGDPATALLGLVRGSARVLRTRPDGQEKVVHLLTAPVLVAEVPTLTGEALPATAVCGEDCMVVAIPRTVLVDAVRKDPEFALRILAVVFDRLQQLTRALARHGQRNAAARVGAWILARDAPSGVLPAAKKDVADYLGLQPETFSRALAVLRTEGGVEVEGDAFRILDRSALERFLNTHESS